MVSAIVRSACLRPFVRSSVSPEGVVVKGPGSAPFPGLPRRRIVCRCSPRSTSFVLAALRALQVDRCCARRGGQRSRKSAAAVRPSGRGRSRTDLGPSRRRSCWRGVPSRSRSPRPSCRGPAAADHSAGRRGRHATARSQDRSAPAVKLTLPSRLMLPSRRFPSRLILRRGQTGGTVELRAPRQRAKSPTAAP